MSKKIHGFDYLRAMCCILVVAWHLNLLGPLTRENAFLVNVVNIFNYNIELIAVPIFFQISLFLFYQNRHKRDYFIHKRLPLLIKLYCFWTVVTVISTFLIKKELPQLGNVQDFLLFIITGDDRFWFFFSLIFVTCLAELTALIVSKQSEKHIKINLVLFIIACVSVFVLPLINLYLGESYKIMTAWWLPFNFTPYIFSAYILANIYPNNFNSNFKPTSRLTLFLLILTLLFIVIEWKFLDVPGKWYFTILPQYSRLSLVFSSLLLTWLSLYIHTTPRAIALVSDCSLGISLFCHPPQSKI